MRDFTDDLAELRSRVADAHAYLRIDDARERLAELEVEASRPDLWDDPDAARTVTTELSRRPRRRRARRRARRARRPIVADAVRARPRGRRRVASSREIASGIDDARAPSSTSSSCARCSPASTTSATRSARCTPARAAPTRRTGPRCCCACSRAGRSGEGFDGRARRGQRRHRGRHLARRRSSSRAATRTGCSPARRACTG